MSAIATIDAVTRERLYNGVARRLVSTVDLPRDEWLKVRDLGLGSSDAAASMGLDPYKTPRVLAREKRHEIEPADLSDNEAVELGILLEPIVLELFERRTGYKTERVRAVLQSVEHPFMLANIDSRIVGRDEMVEAKTTGLFAALHGDWGDPESEPDRVPTRTLCQAMHALAVTGHKRCHVPVLIGGQTFRIYTIDRDEALIASMVQREKFFWEGVQSGTTPAAINYDEIFEEFKQHIESPIEATQDILEIVRRYAAAKATANNAKKESEDLKDPIALFMREHDTLTLYGQPILTWRTQTRKAHSVAASTSRVIRLVTEKT